MPITKQGNHICECCGKQFEWYLFEQHRDHISSSAYPLRSFQQSDLSSINIMSRMEKTYMRSTVLIATSITDSVKSSPNTVGGDASNRASPQVTIGSSWPRAHLWAYSRTIGISSEQNKSPRASQITTPQGKKTAPGATNTESGDAVQIPGRQSRHQSALL